jgi:recombinational DNA repair protein RecT
MGKIFDTLISKEEHFRAALGSKRDFDSWFAQTKVWIMKTENDDRFDYSRVSVADTLGAYTTAAVLGLLIDGEECMVMIRGRSQAKIKCEVGAKGVIRMAGQAGWTINSRTVRQGDLIELDEGSGHVKHVPAALVGNESGESIGYYSTAKRRGGIQIVRFMSKEDAEKRSTETGAWKSWFDEMGEKSAVLSLRKVLYFGDEIEGLIASTGAEMGDVWGQVQAEQEAAEEPTHPPRGTSDRVQAAARRASQDRDAEMPQDEPEEGSAFVDGPHDNSDLGGPGEEVIPI